MRKDYNTRLKIAIGNTRFFRILLVLQYVCVDMIPCGHIQKKETRKVSSLRLKITTVGFHLASTSENDSHRNFVFPIREIICFTIKGIKE